MSIQKLLPKDVSIEIYSAPKIRQELGFTADPWLAQFVYMDPETSNVSLNMNDLAAGESPNEAVLKLLELNAGETIFCGKKSILIPIELKDITF